MKKILVADDRATSRELVRVALEHSATWCMKPPTAVRR